MIVPELVAHRGYPLHYPENTLVGIEAAIRAGARYVEVDVQLAADQVPVLFHDRDLRRLCGVSGAVHDSPFARLRELRAGEFGRFGYKFAQERLATLAELAVLLSRYPQVTAFVELKRISLERFGVPTVLERVRRELQPVLGQCVLISYDMAALAAARTPHGPPLGAVVDRWGERHHGPVRAIRPEYLFCDVAGLPRFGRLHYPGARIAIYEVTDAQIALRLAARGAALIETFAYGELRQALALAAGA